jgi:hypothetical protein
MHPDKMVHVSLLPPAADAGGRTSAYVSLKNAIRASLYVYINQGNAATILLSVLQATAVAGTGSKAISATRIWTNEDAATAVPVTKQTDAATFTTSAAVKMKLVIFDIDPGVLDVPGGFDCIAVSTGASNAANITSAFLLAQPKFPGSTAQDYLAD